MLITKEKLAEMVAYIKPDTPIDNCKYGTPWRVFCDMAETIDILWKALDAKDEHTREAILRDAMEEK